MCDFKSVMIETVVIMPADVVIMATKKFILCANAIG